MYILLQSQIGGEVSRHREDSSEQSKHCTPPVPSPPTWPDLPSRSKQLLLHLFLSEVSCCLKESERVLTFAVWFSVMGLPRSRAVQCGESFQDLRQKNIIRADCSHFQLLPNLIDKETKNATTSERESRAVITAGSSSLCGDLYLEL